MFKPTEEQQEILKAFKDTRMLKVNAYAGTGKSSTLQLLANANQQDSLYIAFNKSIATEAKSKFPSHVECRTTHSLAFAEFGRQIMHKLNRPKGRYVNVAGTPAEIARYYALTDFIVLEDEESDITANMVGKLVRDTVTRYEQSSDLVIEDKHVPFYKIMEYAKKRPSLDKKMLVAHIKQYAELLWNDRKNVHTQVLATHDTYLKLYQLSNPKLNFDIIYLDEGQDTGDAVLDIVLKQDHAKIVIVGDNFQCVDSETPVKTPGGEKPVKDIRIGDEVLSYVNGNVETRKVQNVVKSDWEFGYKVTTESGKKLTMSPNHKIWCSDFALDGAENIVYLMYRKDKGFRVGITNNYKGQYRFGSRTLSERASRFWVLGVESDKEKALYKEQYYSLKYGIPTCVFEAESRGINQDRIDRVFNNFGHNGYKLLSDLHLDFDIPHYLSKTCYTKGREQVRINLSGNSSKGSTVSIEWDESQISLKSLLSNYGDLHVTTAKKEGRYRIRKYFKHYKDAYVLAHDLSKVIPNGVVWERMSCTDFDNGMILMTASGLHVGCYVMVDNGKGTLVPDKIVSKEFVEGEFYDLEVDKSANFIGGGILSHNSIYQWRGAVNAMQKVNCPTRYLTKSFRFGEEIAQVASAIIEAEKPVRGFEEITSSVGAINYERPHTRIYRTNAALLSEAVDFLQQGYSVSCEVDTRDFKKLIESALELKRGNTKGVKHDSVVPYSTWQEMKEASEDEPELKRVISIINQGRHKLFMDSLKYMKSKSGADITFTTAHKSKGREWKQVYLAEDFVDPDKKGNLPEQERNLLYVAATRAIETLFVNDALSIILDNSSSQENNSNVVATNSEENFTVLVNAERGPQYSEGLDCDEGLL